MICHEIETEILAKFTNVHRIQFTTTFSVLFFHIEVGSFRIEVSFFAGNLELSNRCRVNQKRGNANQMWLLCFVEISLNRNKNN